MLTFKEQISDTILAYKKNREDAEASVEKVIENYQKNNKLFDKYQPQYKIQAFKEAVDIETKPIIEDAKKTDIVLNQKVKAIIDEKKKEVLPKQKEKSPDYALKVSNALKYLEIEGKKLTDETAFNILKDFIDDYDQMKLFKQVIKRQLNIETFTEVDGTAKFPQTFSKFNKIQILLNTFDEMEKISNTLFLIYKDAYQFVLFYNARIEFPALNSYTYQELANEDNIIELAEIIDNFVENENSIVKNINEVH